MLIFVQVARSSKSCGGVEGVESEKKVESDATEADEPSAEEKQTTEGEDAGEDDGLGKSLGELMIGTFSEYVLAGCGRKYAGEEEEEGDASR